jgi:predicted dehydrogenase
VSIKLFICKFGKLTSFKKNTTNQALMVKWGIIGVGNVTEKKSGPAFQKVESSELVAVMRRTGDLAEDYAERHGVPKWFDNAEKLINDPEVDAIYIATPPDSHEKYTLMAAEAGKPVYVEKPMARSYVECKRMIKACVAHNVPLFVAYYRRALPNFLKVKQLIDEKTIGDVRFIDCKVHKAINKEEDNSDNWRVNPKIGGGGYFYDLASHQLDFFDFLFGPIVKASGISKNNAGLYAANDTTVGTFEFENGVAGTGSWCFAVSRDSETEQTIIYGSKGRIEFDFFGKYEVSVFVDGQDVQKLTFDMPMHIQQPLIQTVVDELNGEPVKCPSTGTSAARTNWVLEEIYA